MINIGHDGTLIWLIHSDFIFCGIANLQKLQNQYCIQSGVGMVFWWDLPLEQEFFDHLVFRAFRSQNALIQVKSIYPELSEMDVFVASEHLF